MGKKKSFKKISLFDLAAIRVINSEFIAEIKEGDLIEIVEPFIKNENYLGTVLKFNEKTMSIYHADIRKEIVWNRRVKCKVYAV